MRAGDDVAVAVLRTTLGVVDNAGAIDVRQPATAIEASPYGAGATEMPRQEIADDDVRRLVRAEIAEREAAAATYTAAGHPERAQRLLAEAEVLRSVLEGR